MEYRRHRASSRQKRSDGGARLLTVLILIGAGLYFMTVSTAGKWISNKIVEPVFSVFMKKGDSNTGTPQDSQSVSSTGESLLLPQIECYFLQTGVFSTLENAQAGASQVAGATGSYVFFDGERYRVFTAGFSTETMAREAKESFTQNNIDCSIYHAKSESGNFAVMANSAQGAGKLQELFYALAGANDDLLTITAASGTMTDAQIKEAVQAVCTTIESAKTNAGDLPEQTAKSLTSIIDGMKNVQSATNLQVTAALYCAQMQLACGYIDMINSLM